MKRQFFGTDGIRGEVGVWPMHPQFLMQLGYTLGHYLHDSGLSHQPVLIGKDPRTSSDVFEAAVATGLASAGISVSCLGYVPTPAVAYLTRTSEAGLGLMISASHNAYTDNGIKIFTQTGTKLPDDVEVQLEHACLRVERLSLSHPQSLGRVRQAPLLMNHYWDHCAQALEGHNLNGLHIVVDCAFGACSTHVPTLLASLGATVTAIAHEPNFQNINEHCGTLHPQWAQQTLLETGADLGILFDGDGDRVLLIDASGRLYDGDDLLYVFARDARQRQLPFGGVVGTLMSNLGLEKALQSEGIPFVRTAVGDRYVAEKMRELQWQLGGETSGHVITHPKTYTGDGIVTALHLLSILKRNGITLAEAVAPLHKCAQHLINLPYPTHAPDPLSIPEISASLENIQHQFSDRVRLLLRRSGTEPVVRVMVEGEDRPLIQDIGASLVELIQHLTLKKEIT